MFHLNLFRQQTCRTVQLIRSYKSILGPAYNGAQSQPAKVKDTRIEKKRSWNILPEVVKYQRSQLLKNKECHPSLVTKSSSRLQHGLKKLTHTGDPDMLAGLDTTELKQVLAHLTEPRGQLSFLLDDVEAECCHRVHDLDLESLLYIADAFILMQHRAGHYIRMMFHQLYQQWDQMQPSSNHLLQILFLVGVYRSAPAELLNEIEKLLSVYAGSYNTAEISLVCNAFFASNKAIGDISILDTFAKTILAHKGHIHHYEAANYMKCFKHAGFTDLDFYSDFGTRLAKQIGSFTSLSSLGSVAHTYSSLRIQHPSLTVALMDQAATIIEEQQAAGRNTRSKDIVRLVGCAANLGVPVEEDLLDFLVDEFESNSQLRRDYPEMFVEGLVNLALAGCYPSKCISLALSPANLRMKKGRLLEQNYQLLLLDAVAQLLCEKYRGERLSQEFIASLPEGTLGNEGLEVYTRNGLAPLWVTLRRLLGPEKVRLDFHLKHSKVAGLELRQDGEGNYVAFNKEDTETRELAAAIEERVSHATGLQGGKSVIQTVMEESLLEKHQLFWNRKVRNLSASRTSGSNKERRQVIRLCGWNQYFLNSETLTSSTRLELKMLNQKGYDVFMISPNEAADLDSMDTEHLTEYANNCILGR